MNAAMLMLVASTFSAPSTPATAASLGAGPAPVIGRHVTFVSDASLPVAQTAAAGAKAKGSVGGKPVTLAVQGGIFVNVGTGFFVGLGMSLQPGHSEKVEFLGDFSIGHGSNLGVGYSVWNISFNGIYDLQKSSGGLMPFIGGGLSIVHGSVNGFGATNTGVQLIGGVQLNSSGEHVIRVSVRIVFTAGTPIVFLVGYSF